MIGLPAIRTPSLPTRQSLQSLPLQGLVRRRILVNFRVDPEVVGRQLPPPFRPKLVDGWAMAGICLIRLEQLRPRGIPACLGLSSENAAHRIAVTWDDELGQAHDGVYIPRRDTGACLNAAGGGCLFPAEQHHAHFPADSVNYDCTLIMRDLPHKWQPVPPPLESSRDRFTPVSSTRPSNVRRLA